MNEIQKGIRGRCTVGVHVPDELGSRSQTESLNQGASFPNGVLEFKVGDARELVLSPLDHGQRCVPTTVEDHDDGGTRTEAVTENPGVGIEDRTDTVFLVVRWNQEKNGGDGFCHRGAELNSRLAWSPRGSRTVKEHSRERMGSRIRTRPREDWRIAQEKPSGLASRQ
jgi:hypothetical protein